MNSELAYEFITQAMAHRRPPKSVTMRGPYLSTNQPSTGTSHVSVTMKIVNATWMAARSQPCFSCMGLTKNVQPYCMLAIMHMQMTPKINCIQRNESGFPATSVVVASFAVSIALSSVFLGLSIVAEGLASLKPSAVNSRQSAIRYTGRAVLGFSQRCRWFNSCCAILELRNFSKRIKLRIGQDVRRCLCIGKRYKDEARRDRGVDASLQGDRAAPCRDPHCSRRSADRAVRDPAPKHKRLPPAQGRRARWSVASSNPYANAQAAVLW